MCVDDVILRVYIHIHTIYAKQKYQIAKLAYTCKCLIIIDVCIEEFWGSHCADTACCMSTGQTKWWRKGDADCQSAKEPLKIQRSSWCFIFFSAYFTYRPTGQRKCSNMRQSCIWGFGFITFLKQKFTKLTESSSNQFLLWTLCFRNHYIYIYWSSCLLFACNIISNIPVASIRHRLESTWHHSSQGLLPNSAA